MVEAVSYLYGVLTWEPGYPLLGQSRQRLLVKSIPHYDGNVRADLTLKVDDPWKAESQYNLHN